MREGGEGGEEGGGGRRGGEGRGGEGRGADLFEPTLLQCRILLSSWCWHWRWCWSGFACL